MICFAPAAEVDLRHIRAWITDDNGPIVAARVTEAILASIRNLEHFPQLGRLSRREGVRELGVPRLPYIVVYKLAGGDVMVARIMHGAQRTAPDV